ncbi:hypothetical protein ARMGADRAFT_1085493 [Armillaria gallica]|uniref:F-box domain-containing protein n=1 Tax=Armillaria gallica TaxID=47427 RepID=A0A2H3D166_ARMGA|nr:hypothetical protein ARMGADRAFT_1085493 [Armillaria gallica]
MSTTSAISDDPSIGPPISRIPVELTAKIFLCTKDGPLKVGDRGSIVFIIASVCRGWRDIMTTGCPDLWRALDLDLRDRGNSDIEVRRLKDFVSCALKRSRIRLLLIRFRSPTIDVGIQAAGSREIFRLLIHEAARWQSASLWIDYNHLALLEGIRNSRPPLRTFSINLSQSGNLSSDNVRALEFAGALELVSISGLPRGAVIFLDTSSLTEFEEHRSSIEANVLDTWIALLPFANNLTSVAMWYGDILRVVYGRRSHALLPAVTSFSSGSIDVFDAVTLPKLALLSLSTISERDDPLTLTAARRMLVRSNTSHTLRGLEIRNVPLTGDIVSIFDLSPCLDQVTLECNMWTPETDTIIRRLLTVKLAHCDMDGGLTCTPLLSRLRLTIAHQLQPFSISFYNEGLVDMMEVRRPEDPDGRFSLCIVVEDSIQRVTFVPLTSESRSRLCQYHEHGCCLSLTVGGTIDEHITSVRGSSSW